MKRAMEQASSGKRKGRASIANPVADIERIVQVGAQRFVEQVVELAPGDLLHEFLLNAERYLNRAVRIESARVLQQSATDDRNVTGLPRTPAGRKLRREIHERKENERASEARRLAALGELHVCECTICVCFRSIPAAEVVCQPCTFRSHDGRPRSVEVIVTAKRRPAK